MRSLTIKQLEMLIGLKTLYERAYDGRRQRHFARYVAGMVGRPVSQPTICAWLSGKTPIPEALEPWMWDRRKPSCVGDNLLRILLGNRPPELKERPALARRLGLDDEQEI